MAMIDHSGQRPGHGAVLAGPARTVPARARYVPLVFFQVYLGGSLVAFVYGPLQSQITNWALLLSYALVGQLVILVGYLLGASWRPRSYSGRWPPMLVVGAAILVALAVLPATLGSRNYAGVSIVDAVINPGAAYEAFSEGFRSTSGIRPLSVVRTLLGPVLGLLIPLGIVYWRQMRASWRTLWLVALMGRIWVALISGPAFYLFDILLVVPWFLWLARTVNERRSGTETGGRPRSRRWGVRRVLLAVTSVAILVVGLWFFNYSRLSRYRLQEDDFPPRATGWSEELYGVPLAPSVESGIYFTVRYWTMGYEGLAGCLQLPFKWSGGLGHSLFLSRYAARLSSDLGWIEGSSYPARLERLTGYRADWYWHTIYPWLASDLTFAGAWLFMGVLSFWLAAAWSDSLFDRNPFALGLVGQLLLLFFYIPANNIRLGSPEAAVTFWGLLALWLVTRGRSNVGA